MGFPNGSKGPEGARGLGGMKGGGRRGGVLGDQIKAMKNYHVTTGN